MVYINFKGGEGNETVDECGNRKEAEALLKDYQQSDKSGQYWISAKPCSNWKEDKQ